MQEQAENPQAEEPKAAPKPKFELIGEPVAKKDGLYTISGILKNNTDKTYSYAQICFNVYDKDGNQLGTAIANVNNLELAAHGNLKQFRSRWIMTKLRKF